MMPIPLVEVLVWVWVFVELSSSLMMRTIPLILWKGFLLAISCLGFEFASFLIKPEGMCCFCVAGHQAKFLSKSSLACYIFKVELGTWWFGKGISKLNLYNPCIFWVIIGQVNKHLPQKTSYQVFFFLIPKINQWLSLVVWVVVWDSSGITISLVKL